MKKFAVIVAGGSGQRMGAGIPKQFILLKGKPVLYYTIKTFLDTFDDLQVILVLPAANMQTGQALIDEMQWNARVQLREGGETRFHSVKNGLQLVTEPSIVFVHDGVRCMITQDLIQRCYETAMQHGSAIPAVAATDSIRISNGASHHAIDRTQVRIIQTPQTFQSNLILTAYNQPYREAFTDEATVVEATGKQVFLVEGEYSNIKITRPVDLVIAEKMMGMV